MLQSGEFNNLNSLSSYCVCCLLAHNNFSSQSAVHNLFISPGA